MQGEEQRSDQQQYRGGDAHVEGHGAAKAAAVGLRTGGEVLRDVGLDSLGEADRWLRDRNQRELPL